MCLIIAIPVGVPKIYENIVPAIKNSIVNNDDGAGFALKTKEGIFMSKGYYEEQELLDALKLYLTDIDPLESELIIHLRNGNIGAISKELSHPFPCTDNVEDLGMTMHLGTDQHFMAHNGTFQGVGTDKALSDTYLFTRDYLSKAPVREMMYHHTELFKELFDKKLNNSRVVLMSPDPEQEFVKVGTWQEEEGILYSNVSYKNPKVTDRGGVVTYEEEYEDWRGGYSSEINFPTSNPTNYIAKNTTIKLNTLISKGKQFKHSTAGDRVEYLGLTFPKREGVAYVESLDTHIIPTNLLYPYLRMTCTESFSDKQISILENFSFIRALSNKTSGKMFLIGNTNAPYNKEMVTLDEVKTKFDVRFKPTFEEERFMYFDLVKGIAPSKNNCKYLSRLIKFKSSNDRVDLGKFMLKGVKVNIVRAYIQAACKHMNISEFKYLESGSLAV